MKIKGLFVESYGDFRLWVLWVGGLALLAALIAGPTALIRHGDAVSCRNTARAMHRAYRSGFLEGCLVRLDNGTFIPLGNLRTTDVERTR